MDKKRNFSLIITAVVLGFMLAIQFNSVNEPVVRDTRDQWELRGALLKEKELHSRLLSEIRSNEEKLAKYETEWKQSREQALKETLAELKKDAGLTEITGPGLVMVIEPIFNEFQPGMEQAFISPELLQRLLNELNMYGAKEISVAGQRVVHTTVIRDINGETKIDGFSLRHFPLEISVVTENEQTAEKLYNRMQVSQSIESFYIDSLKVEILQPQSHIEIPPYGDSIRVRDMEPVKHEKGGNS